MSSDASTFVIETLEPRRLLSGLSLADDVALITWHGQEMLAKNGEWIVQLDHVSGSRDDQLARAAELLGEDGITPLRRLGADGLFLIETEDGDSFEQLETRLSDVSGFVSLEPNLIYSTTASPNDPKYSMQWALKNAGQSGGTSDADIDANVAWDLTKGSSSVVVAVIDSGVDYNHPDLAANMWKNPGEVRSDGIDNDGNGYVDDYFGYDFFSGGDSNPMDAFGHGTHVAGTIAAVGNNAVGTTGVSWNTKIMAIKITDNSGLTSVAYEVEATNYVTMMRNRGVNVRVSNNSYGGQPYSAAQYNAIKSHGDAGILFVAAAGNGTSSGVGQNNDSTPFYPGSYDHGTIIAVAATDDDDTLAAFSNYGATTVDLAAPGVSIYSTIPNSSYGYKSGTSAATPFVSGVAALAFAYSPGASVSAVRNAILNGVDAKSSLSGKMVTGGRLNAYHTLQLLNTAATQTPYLGSPFSVSSTPITIQAEHFDTGGEGIAYHDTTSSNTGAAFRTSEGVDIKTTTDAGGGYRISDAKAGEWLEYTIDVKQSGSYKLEFRVASDGAGGNFHAEINSANVTGTLTVPNTGGWSSMTTLSKTVSLSTGVKVLRLKMDTQGSTGYTGAFNWLRFSPAGSSSTTLATSTAAYVRGGTHAGSNFGSSSDLVVKKSSTAGSNRESYITFDLSGVSSIESAMLRLYGRLGDTSSSSLTTNIYSSSNTSWSESTLSWNNKPAAGSTLRASFSVSGTSNQWYEINLTSFLKAEKVAGRNVVTLVLKNASSSNAQTVFSSDETGNGPRLLITP